MSRGELVRTLLTAPGMSALLSPLMRGRAVIFRLHRVRDRERGTPGRDPQKLRRVLSYLRRERYPVLPLDELVRRLAGEGLPPDRAVAISMDDGYVDQATIAAPLFAEFDCPVTTFVTTGFLDGQLWFWWDKVDLIFRTTRYRTLKVSLDDTAIEYSLDTQVARTHAKAHFIDRCKQIADGEKHAAIARLAAEAEVELPARAPAEYAPMSWDQLRTCEGLGMSFAPHSVSHPILSRTSIEQSRHEIVEAWGRLRSEASRPVPVFAYPNGRASDYGVREIEILRELRFLGAVVTTPGYNSRTTLRDSPHSRFTLRRFGNADSLSYVARVVTGFERVKARFWGWSE